MDSRQIGWRQEVFNAQSDEGSLIDSQDAFLITSNGQLPRDMAKDGGTGKLARCFEGNG